MFASAGERIAVVVTDMVMPGGKGNELVARLKVHHPMLKVVYMSGYAAGTAIDHKELGRGETFLQKPFTAEALLAKLRDVLAVP